MRLPFAWGFLAALFLLLGQALPASAQTSPVPPRCEPAPIGNGTYPKVVDTVNGTWSVYWCGDEYGWYPEFNVKSADYKLRLPESAEIAGKSMVELYRMIWALNAGQFPTDPKLAILWTEARDWAEANKPAAPVWRVRAVGTSVERPVYRRNTNGTLGALISTIKAPSGTECACPPEWRIRVSTLTYCPWIGAETEPVVQVTVCTRATTP